MKEHFYDDERGRQKAMYFLPWHFDFLTRYRPLPEAEFGAQALETPLMQTRADELPDDLPALDRLLTHSSPSVHELIANHLWEATSDADAVGALTALAESPRLLELERAEQAQPKAAPGDATELANIPSTEAKGGKHRRSRQAAPRRTEAEFAVLRAERAAKRARTGAPAHVNGNRR